MKDCLTPEMLSVIFVLQCCFASLLVDHVSVNGERMLGTEPFNIM